MTQPLFSQLDQVDFFWQLFEANCDAALRLESQDELKAFGEVQSQEQKKLLAELTDALMASLNKPESKFAWVALLPLTLDEMIKRLSQDIASLKQEVLA